MTPTSMRRLLCHWFGGTWGENLVVRIVYGHVHYCSPQKLMLKVCIPLPRSRNYSGNWALCL